MKHEEALSNVHSRIGFPEIKMMTLLLFFLALTPVARAENLNEAVMLYNRGHYRQASQILQHLAKTDPNNAEVRLWLGKSYLKTRDWDKAVHEMEKAVELKPTADNHLWLGRACGARAEHSFALKAFGWARRVLKAFETARKIAPDNLDVRFDLLEYYLRAPGLVGGGRDKAEAEAKAIAEYDPKKGYTARSQIMMNDKKWDLARKELLQATLNYPENSGAFKDLAGFLLERQDFGGAVMYAKKAMALDRNSKRSRLILAAAAIHLKEDLESAIRILNDLASGQLTDDDPSFEEVYYWLGRAYLATGDTAKARETFYQSLSFNPEYGSAKEQLAKLK